MNLPAQRGTFLLEALTAIAIFALGVLGTVALHAHAIRHVSGAQHRGEAVQLVHALLGAMWAENPATLAARYDGTGDGYATFAGLARRLPGADSAGNLPDIRVASGPSATSQVVSVTVRWQMPGASLASQYTTSAVIGRN